MVAIQALYRRVVELEERVAVFEGRGLDGS
jgi:hypothetical protein